MSQDGALGFGKVLALFVTAKLPSLNIDRGLADLHPGRAAPPLGAAAAPGFHPRNKLARGKGLYDVIIGAGAQPRDPLLLGPARRQDYDRQGRMGLPKLR